MVDVNTIKDHGFVVGQVVKWGSPHRITAISGSTLSLEPFNFEAFKTARAEQFQSDWDALKAKHGGKRSRELNGSEVAERQALTSAYNDELDTLAAQYKNPARVVVVQPTAKTAASKPVKSEE